MHEALNKPVEHTFWIPSFSEVNHRYAGEAIAVISSIVRAITMHIREDASNAKRQRRVEVSDLFHWKRNAIENLKTRLCYT